MKKPPLSTDRRTRHLLQVSQLLTHKKHAVSATTTLHKPVLLRQVLASIQSLLKGTPLASSSPSYPSSKRKRFLSNVDREDVNAPLTCFVDCTLGMANHSLAVARAFHPHHVVAFERDGAILGMAKANLASAALPGSTKFHLHQVSYATLSRMTHIKEALGIEYADFILMDLGVCSVQLDQSSELGTGMSFKSDAPLDMRFDRSGAPDDSLTAHTIINHYTESQLAEVIRVHGEDGRYRQIASAIVAARPVATTHELIEKTRHVISASRLPNAKNGWTKLFQALRMEVNDELGHLRRGLKAALDCLPPPPASTSSTGTMRFSYRSGKANAPRPSITTTTSSSTTSSGRLAVISFHSLEDREVKLFFKEAVRSGRAKREELLIPDEEELEENPRARSAKLRILSV